MSNNLIQTNSHSTNNVNNNTIISKELYHYNKDSSTISKISSNNLTINNDLSINNNLSVQNNLSILNNINLNPNIPNTTSNHNFIVKGDGSFNNLSTHKKLNLFSNSDISLGNNVSIQNDLSLNGNLL